MPLSTGVYTPPSPEYPAIPNTTILASDFNTIVDDLAIALSLAIYKDGQASMAANLNMATFKITNLGAGTNPTDATNVLQVFTDPTFIGTTGTGVNLTGTKATLNVAVLDVIAPDINITATTLDAASGQIALSSTTTTSIAATTSLTETAGTSASLVAGTSLALQAGTTMAVQSTGAMSIQAGATLTESATSSITITAPTITAVGSLVSTLNTLSTAVTQVPGTDNTTLATTAFVQQASLAASIPDTVSAILFYNLDYI